MPVNEILSERMIVDDNGYFDALQHNFYYGIRAAYYGPEIEAMDLLPDRFEAEERSVSDTSEILQLVSGRTLFGAVCITDKIPELTEHCYKILPCSGSVAVDSYRSNDNEQLHRDNAGRSANPMTQLEAYKNLELHVFGRLVAKATRLPPKSVSCTAVDDENSLDQIHVLLTSDENRMPGVGNPERNGLDTAVSDIPLGKITGIGTTSDESSCYVYNSFGTKSRVILKNRTLLVKHMHWFQLGDEVSVCECRCTRARLPPSEFWLFELRCRIHDIGGCYVETFGRDKKRKTVPSQRYWDGIDADQKVEKLVFLCRANWPSWRLLISTMAT